MWAMMKNMAQWHRVLSQSEIATAIEAAARRMAADYAGRELVLVGLMDGALFFLADLARRLTALCPMPPRLATLRPQSYGAAAASSGRVHLDPAALPFALTGADVLVVDDIYDSGRTLRRVLDTLAEKRPRSLEVACLLVKDAPRAEPVTLRYGLLPVPNQFVIGAGLDLAGHGRTLPDLWAVEAGTSEQAALAAFAAQFGRGAE